MCDIHRSLDGVQISLNCTKAIRKTKRSTESDKTRRRGASSGGGGGGLEEESNSDRKHFSGGWRGPAVRPRQHDQWHQDREVTLNRLTPHSPSFPSTVPPLSSIIPTTRPLSWAAYGGLLSSPAILTGKHSPGHNAADKTRHLLVLLKQDRTICSSAPISPAPHRCLLKIFLPIAPFRRFQVAYSSPPRVQSPHLCPLPIHSPN